MIVTFPPDAHMMDIADPAAAGAEYLQRIPGLAEKFEPENPGMHKTETTDYGIVLEGEVVCMFDKGEVTLKAGDVLVQDHTRHGWSNRTNAPAKVAFVLIG
nr:H216 [uncultured bacterium]